MRTHIKLLVPILSTLFVIAGCGGSGGSSTLTPSAPGATASNVPSVSLTFSGATTLARTHQARKPMTLDGTSVTISYQGQTVASGSLNANGSVTITLPTSIPEGATVLVTAGGTTISAMLATSSIGTIIAVTVNNDGTLTVTTQPDASKATSTPAPGGDGSTTVEKNGGTPISFQSGASRFWPTVLPVHISTDCKVITITPSPLSQSPLFADTMLIEMKAKDSDSTPLSTQTTAFQSVNTFNFAPGTQRVHLRFTLAGVTVLDLVGAFDAQSEPPTAGTGLSTPKPTPAPCPTP